MLITTTRQTEKAVNNAERKLQIALKALELFAARGYDNTTVDDITEACGMSKGNFYYYFKTKEGLVYLLRDWAVKDFDAEQKNLENKLQEIGPREALKYYFAVYVRNVDAALNAYNFLNHVIVSLEPEGRRRLMQGSIDVSALFSRILTAGVETGVFEIKNIRLTAHNITRFGSNWAHSHWQLRQYLTLDEYISQQMEFVLKFISKQ